MKNSVRNSLVVALATIGFGIVSAAAQIINGELPYNNVITVALILHSQGSFGDNGTVRIYTKPAVRRMNTKDMLSQLARDKFAQGLYPTTFFPAGSKLVNFGDVRSFAHGGSYYVVNRDNKVLVDVSDIIIQITAGTNDILSGRVSDATGVAQPNTTELILVEFKFDDNFISGGGNLSFFAEGLDTIKTKDSTPAVAGDYRESTSDSVKNITGEGQSNGTQFVVTGSIHGNDSVNLATAN
jgi:hypothetical protein